jgi:hypothetical protein
MIGVSRRGLGNREGFALATTLLVIMVLTILAVAATWLATSEKRTSFAEGVHIGAVFSADSGGEAAINFIRLSGSPPPIMDFGSLMVRNQGNTNIQGQQAFEYNCAFLNRSHREGWGLDFLDYNYRVVSLGEAGRDGQSSVDLVAGRLFQEGY